MKKTKSDFFKYTSFNIIAMVGVSIYILADTFFISKVLGAVGLAALNFSIVIFTLIQGVGLMAGIGGAIDFSIKKSEKNSSGKTSLYNALSIGMLFSAIFIVLGIFFTTQISLFLGADKYTLDLTKTYITTILWFSPFFILNNIVLAFVRNDNCPRLAMMAMIISSFSNIVLDYIFMFPLKMGIFGAAFATGLSPIISLLILATHFKYSSKNFQFSEEKIDVIGITRIVTLGFPSFITEFASAITLFIFNILILKIEGNTGVAAYGIIANVAIVVVAIFTGLAQGIQPLISNYYSRLDKNGVLITLKYSLVTSITLSVVIYIMIFIFSNNIVSVFNSENNELLKKIAEDGLKIYFTGFIFAGVNIVLVSFFSATSETSNAMVISVLRSSFLLIPVVIALSVFFGINGIWVSFVATELCVTALAYFKYSSSLKVKVNSILYNKFII